MKLPSHVVEFVGGTNREFLSELLMVTADSWKIEGMRGFTVTDKNDMFYLLSYFWFQVQNLWICSSYKKAWLFPKNPDPSLDWD